MHFLKSFLLQILPGEPREVIIMQYFTTIRCVLGSKIPNLNEDWHLGKLLDLPFPTKN